MLKQRTNNSSHVEALHIVRERLRFAEIVRPSKWLIKTLDEDAHRSAKSTQIAFNQSITSLNETHSSGCITKFDQRCCKQGGGVWHWTVCICSTTGKHTLVRNSYQRIQGASERVCCSIKLFSLPLNIVVILQCENKDAYQESWTIRL